MAQVGCFLDGDQGGRHDLDFSKFNPLASHFRPQSLFVPDKTTGPSKQVRSREIYVAAQAFLVDESRLKVRWDLWEKSDALRQMFIVLPTGDLTDFTNFSAIPADRVALTCQILAVAGLQLDEAEDDTIIIDAASRLWTEHFSRAALVSMARAIHVSKSIADRMGWWSVG